MLNKFVLCLYFFALASGWNAPSHSNSSPMLSRTVTFAEIGYSTDDTLQGVLVTRDYTVHWPDAWSAQPGNKLTLNFSHFTGLEPHSSLAIDWNGARISSVLLTAANAENGSVQVDIPETTIKTGYNQLHLEVYMGIDDDYCQDLDNPSLWVTIHSTSNFSFAYNLVTPALDLGRFPTPLVDNSDMVDNSVTFILPDKPSLPELTAMATISAKLGQLTAWRTMQTAVLLQSQTSDIQSAKGDLIYIGRLDRLKGLDTSTLPFVSSKNGTVSLIDSQGQALPAEAGILWEQPAPGDNTAIALLVTGLNDPALLTAAHALADSSSYSRFSGPLGVITNMPVAAPANKGLAQAISFEDLGYQDETAAGTRLQTIEYIIPLPQAWQIQDQATLDLHFSHSELAVAKRSAVNVYLNETPVGSIQLTPENSKNAHATIQLPARLFKHGDNSLTVESDIQLEKGDLETERLDCVHATYREAWLVVYSDSNLNLPGGPGAANLSLAGYPKAFLGSDNLSDLAFVVPDSPNAAIAQSVNLIANRIGHYTSSAVLAPRVIDSAAASAQPQPTPYQILIGQPTKNKAIAQLNSKLPQPFVSGTDQPAQVASIPRIYPPKNSEGYVESLLSTDGMPRLVVTGTTEEGVLWASQALNDLKTTGKLEGDLAILHGQGTISTSSVLLQAKAPAPLPVSPAAQSNVPRLPATWILWLSAGILLITFLILIAKALQGIRSRTKTGVDHGS